jgi:chemotaxis protein methyltransferase CheR
LVVPPEILSNPALLFLYYRIEHLLGIKAASESLCVLNNYLEKSCGASFIDDPAAFELVLDSRDQIFEISKILTVGETYFFREGLHFTLLTQLLPQFSKLNRTIKILSAASSIGCEAYSIAMLLEHYAKNTRHIDFEIDAFDINAEAVETAKNGRYTANSFRKDGSSWKHIMDLYLVPNDTSNDASEDGVFFVCDKIKRKVNYFPHNIMHSPNKQYDIIFFRNALIYFSAQNRIIAVNNLVESLVNNGALFLGISETSSVTHPQLECRFQSGAFFFQKNANRYNSASPRLIDTYAPNEAQNRISELERRNARDRRNQERRTINRREEDALELKQFVKPPHTYNYKSPADCKEIKAILEIDEGLQNARNINQILVNSDGKLAASLTGSELAASSVYFLSVQNYECADLVLSYLEKCDSGPLTLFLRGEYHLLQGNLKEAENFFDRAAGKDQAFWPAFYRIASLAEDGNPVRYEYKIKKTCESLALGKNLHYECFMGGFSPDYFLRILERKLS